MRLLQSIIVGRKHAILFGVNIYLPLCFLVQTVVNEFYCQTRGRRYFIVSNMIVDFAIIL